MSYFDPFGHRGPGLMETLFGWMLSTIMLLIGLSLLIQLLVPLLPWIGLLLLVGISVRWYLLRTTRW